MSGACRIHNGCKRIALPGVCTGTNNSGIVIGEGKKRCSSCGSLLPNTEEFFYKKGSQRPGLESRCKECTKEQHRKWRKKNPTYFSRYNKEHKEEISERRKVYYTDNKETIAVKGREYRSKNKEKQKIRNKKWREENQEHLRRYAAEHREQINARARKRRAEHPEEQEKYNAQRRERWRTDTEWREQRKADNKKWREEHTEHINEYRRKRYWQKKEEEENGNR